MPARIQPNRPYYPRIYPQRAASTRGAPVGRGGRGAIGGGIDTTPTGNIGVDLVKAINATIQQNRQNALANQIMNTQAPPRAAWVGGTAPAAGVSTAGTAPFSGGMGEMQLRQQLEQQDLADQLQRAKIAQALAGANKAQLLAQAAGSGRRGISPWSGGGGGDGTSASAWLGQGGGQGGGKGKKGGYEPNSSTPSDPSYYSFNNQRADIDAQYGKGTYDRLLANAGNVTYNAQTGKWEAPEDSPVKVDEKGNVTINPQGSYAGAHIPNDSLKTNMARYDATLVKQGQSPRFSGQYLGTQNPQTGEQGGSSANPYLPKTTVELNALPPDAWFVNPKDGRTYQKGAAQQPQGPKTSQIDTGDQGQGLADLGQPQQPSALANVMPQPIAPQQPLPALAGLTPGSAPGSFDLGTLPTGGLPDTSLADAIAQARAASQLQGIA